MVVGRERSLILWAVVTAHVLACKDNAPVASEAGADPPTENAASPAADADAKSAADAAPMPSSDAGATAQASGEPPFVFSETPAPNLIPAGPVRGAANGQPFEARHVLLEATRNEWRVSFCERALSRPTDFVHGQALHLYIRDPLVVGKPIVHPMKAGRGYFAIRSADSTNPDGTVSWTSENAYYLEITHLTTKPYDPGGPLVQEAGRASGRVYVAYRGGARFLNSGIAGTFANAVVRYNGRPFWTE